MKQRSRSGWLFAKTLSGWVLCAALAGSLQARPLPPLAQATATPKAASTPILPAASATAQPTNAATPIVPDPSATPTLQPGLTVPILPPTTEGTPSVAKPVSAGIVISDTENHRIVSIEDMTGKGLKSFGFPGHGLGRLLHPAQVWVDHQQRIYIADKGNNRIIRLDEINGRGWTEMGNFSAPEGVCVSGNELFVSDTGNNRICVYSDMGGTLLRTYSDPRIQRPGHLWVDDKGLLYVTCGQDPPGGKVVKVSDMADTSGSRWQVFDGQGLRGVGFQPGQIVTQKSYLWLIDTSSSRLVRCEDLQGKSPRELGGFGNKLGRFQNPRGLAVDAKGNLYVADTGNDRIIFVPGTDVSQWTTWSGKSSNAEAEGISLRSPSSIFVWNPAPPPKPPEDEDKDGKGKKGGKKGK